MIHISLTADNDHRFRPAHLTELSTASTGDLICRLESLFTGSEADQMRALSLFYGLLAEAIPHLIVVEEEQGSAILTSAVAYIRAHFTENYTVSDLAAACHVSESHLHHIFKREWNISPMDYRNEIRLDLATRMMRGSDATTEEILAATGYSSAIYFRELFKRYYGMTPTQFRREICGKR